jgi:hypothetical protein
MFDPDLLLTLGAAVLAVLLVLLAYMPPSVCPLAIVPAPRGRFPLCSFARWATAVFILVNTLLSLVGPHTFPLVSDLIAVGVWLLLLLPASKPETPADEIRAGPAR